VKETLKELIVACETFVYIPADFAAERLFH
jgi:hypothetical protein